MQDELTLNDVYIIHSLCLQDALSFKQIAMDFNKSFKFDKRDRLTVGYGLVTILREHDLVTFTTQRLVLEFLIYQLFDEPINGNPFLCVLLRLMKKPLTDEEDLMHWPVLSMQERHFLGNLLTGNAQQMIANTPAEIAEMDLEKDPGFDLSKLEAFVQDQQARFPTIAKASLLPIMRITDRGFDSDPTYNEQATRLTTCEQLLTGPDAAIFAPPMPPPFLRLPPPLYPVKDEYQFLYPLLLEPLWMPVDPSTSEEEPTVLSRTMEIPETAPPTRSEEIPAAEEDLRNSRVELMRKAMTGTALSQSDTRALTEAIKADPQLLRIVDMSPEKLPRLVEENPRIAVEVLYNLIQAKEEMTAYFEALVSMDLSMVEVPVDFLNLYASHCIRSCEQITNPFNQNRLVRLVCVFLSSLIRNGLLNVKFQDLFAELQTFCLTFTSAKEAAALYQTVQMLVRDEKHHHEDPSGL